MAELKFNLFNVFRIVGGLGGIIDLANGYLADGKITVAEATELALRLIELVANKTREELGFQVIT
jgi:hypothetical protein